MGNVLYYLDENGNKRDAVFHFDATLTPLWDLEDAYLAIQRKINDGMSEDKAIKLFAPPSLKVLLAQGVGLEEAVRRERRKLNAAIAVGEIYRETTS